MLTIAPWYGQSAGLSAETRTNWIYPYILPFLRMTLATSQDVIEETFLPMRFLMAQGDKSLSEDGAK